MTGMAKPAVSSIAAHAASVSQYFRFDELEAKAVGFSNDFGESGVRHFAFVASGRGRHGAVAVVVLSFVLLVLAALLAFSVGVSAFSFWLSAAGAFGWNLWLNREDRQLLAVARVSALHGELSVFQLSAFGFPCRHC